MATAAENLVRKVKPELEAAAKALEAKADPEHIAKGLTHIDRALDVLRASAKKGPRKDLDRIARVTTWEPVKPKRDPTIRERVMARAEAQGGCEWCPPDRKSLSMLLEWHHLRGGGERRRHESVENTAGVCWDCHRGWERGSLEVLHAAKEWSIRLGFRDALRKVEKKIAKVEEARRTPSVAVRLAVRSAKP